MSNSNAPQTAPTPAYPAPTPDKGMRAPAALASPNETDTLRARLTILKALPSPERRARRAEWTAASRRLRTLEAAESNRLAEFDFLTRPLIESAASAARNNPHCPLSYDHAYALASMTATAALAFFDETRIPAGPENEQENASDVAATLNRKRQWWVRRQIQIALSEASTTERNGVELSRYMSKNLRAIFNAESTVGPGATEADIATAAGLTPSQLSSARLVMSTVGIMVALDFPSADRLGSDSAESQFLAAQDDAIDGRISAELSAGTPLTAVATSITPADQCTTLASTILAIASWTEVRREIYLARIGAFWTESPVTASGTAVARASGRSSQFVNREFALAVAHLRKALM